SFTSLDWTQNPLSLLVWICPGLSVFPLSHPHIPRRVRERELNFLANRSREREAGGERGRGFSSSLSPSLPKNYTERECPPTVHPTLFVFAGSTLKPQGFAFWISNEWFAYQENGSTRADFLGVDLR